MTITNIYYADSLPNHWIIERDDGSLKLRPNIPNGHLQETAYRGHRAALIEAKTRPVLSAHGFTASALIPRAEQPRNPSEVCGEYLLRGGNRSTFNARLRRLANLVG